MGENLLGMTEITSYLGERPCCWPIAWERVDVSRWQWMENTTYLSLQFYLLSAERSSCCFWGMLLTQFSAITLKSEIRLQNMQPLKLGGSGQCLNLNVMFREKSKSTFILFSKQFLIFLFRSSFLFHYYLVIQHIQQLVLHIHDHLYGQLQYQSFEKETVSLESAISIMLFLIY